MEWCFTGRGGCSVVVTLFIIRYVCLRSHIGPVAFLAVQMFKCHKEKHAVGFGVQSQLPRYVCCDVVAWRCVPLAPTHTSAHHRCLCGTLQHRYLVLVGDRFLVLEAHPFKVGFGVVKSNHHLAELANLSYKKSAPTRVVLKMKSYKVPGQSDPGRVFHLPDAVAFQRAVVEAVQRLTS